MNRFLLCSAEVCVYNHDCILSSSLPSALLCGSASCGVSVVTSVPDLVKCGLNEWILEFCLSSHGWKKAEKRIVTTELELMNEGRGGAAKTSLSFLTPLPVIAFPLSVPPFVVLISLP